LPSRSAAHPWWTALPDEELLDVPLRDLDLRIAGSRLEPLVERLGDELGRAGVARFRPYAWLSTSWFTPHGTAGFAIPFYAAHPRLVALERRMIGYAEGGDVAGCMRILRHEAGHALDNAYRLHRRATWRDHFGPFGTPYRASFRPGRNRQHFVENLGHGYAQSHPGEDWAETFAVWLTPRSAWRSRYAGLPALRKLCYVNELVSEIADRPPLVRTRERVDPLAEQRATLREHYARKSAQLGRARLRGELLR
jgi:Putative zinc-binding metallo-peptidase